MIRFGLFTVFAAAVAFAQRAPPVTYTKSFPAPTQRTSRLK